MRHFPNLAALLFATLLASAAPAATIDQNVVTTDNPDNNTGLGIVTTSLAQTFTVGMSGVLTGISFNVLKIEGATADLGFELRPASIAGGPDTSGLPLAMATISNASIGTSGASPYAWTTLFLDLTGSGIDVTSGDVLAFVLTSSIGQFFVAQTDYQNSYSGGSRWSADTGSPFSELASADLTFTTYVDPAPVPLPAGLPLLALALAATGLAARRRA